MTRTAYVSTALKSAFFYAAFTLCGFSLAGQYGFADGLLILSLFWSMWVLALPFFGAGLLFSPLTLAWETPLYVCEALSWGCSVLLNAILIHQMPEIYFKTPLTHWLYWALTHPYPYWILAPFTFAPIVLSYFYVSRGVPQSAVLYYHLRYSLMVATLIAFFYCTSYDSILMTNIHV